MRSCPNSVKTGVNSYYFNSAPDFSCCPSNNLQQQAVIQAEVRRRGIDFMVWRKAVMRNSNTPRCVTLCVKGSIRKLFK